MRTIPNHISLPLSPGERRLMCGYCSAKYMRSECRKDASGFWVCPQCDDGGRDQTTLNRLNQQDALNAWVPSGPKEPY